VITEIRPNTKKARDFSLLAKVFNLLGKRQVSEAIAYVRQEFSSPCKYFSTAFQPLANIGIYPGIGKGDSPILDVAVKQLQTLPPPDRTKSFEIIRCNSGNNS